MHVHLRVCVCGGGVCAVSAANIIFVLP